MHTGMGAIGNFKIGMENRGGYQFRLRGSHYGADQMEETKRFNATETHADSHIVLLYR